MINRIDNLTSHYVVCYQRVDVTMYFGNNFFVIASIATLVAMFITFYIKVEWVSTTLTVKFIRVTARDVVVTRLFFLQRNSKNIVSRSCNDDSILLTSFTSVISILEIFLWFIIFFLMRSIRFVSRHDFWRYNETTSLMNLITMYNVPSCPGKLYGLRHCALRWSVTRHSLPNEVLRNHL